MSNLKTGFIDIHSHLLPMQDGPRSVEQAIKAIRIAEKNNISDMIFTPHYYSFDKTYEQNYIMQVFQIIKEEIIRSKIKINVYLGNECAVDEKIIEDIKSGRALTLNKTKYVLCEYPFYLIPCNFSSILYELLDSGYKPIIAHPERNIYIESNYSLIQELKRNGCKIQINAASILGKYGCLSKKYSIKMLKDGIVDYIATDSHSEINRTPESLNKAFRQLRRWIDEEYLLNLFINNSGNLIR